MSERSLENEMARWPFVCMEPQDCQAKAPGPL